MGTKFHSLMPAGLLPVCVRFLESSSLVFPCPYLSGVSTSSTMLSMLRTSQSSRRIQTQWNPAWHQMKRKSQPAPTKESTSLPITGQPQPYPRTTTTCTCPGWPEGGPRKSCSSKSQRTRTEMKNIKIEYMDFDLYNKIDLISDVPFISY